MNEDSVPMTNGSEPNAEKPAMLVELSSLAKAAAGILTAMKPEVNLSSASSAENQSEMSMPSSSPQEDGVANQTTENVTKLKKGKKTMKTKSKAEKKLTMKRLLVRLDKVKTFERLIQKLDRWLADEKDVDRRTQLQNLRNRFQSTYDSQVIARALAEALAESNYVPPKKNFSGTSQLEHGRQVWIKAKFAEAYTLSMPKEQLDNLFVDKVVGGKVVVTVGDPNEAVAIRFPVSKMSLQVTKDAT